MFNQTQWTKGSRTGLLFFTGGLLLDVWVAVWYFTLDKSVELTLPPWTNSGRTFRLKGKGYPAKTGRGDLLATVRIALPEKSDPELDDLMKKWQGEKPYDPRKDM